MGGVPCIRGLRVPVVTVVDRVADGMTRKQILDAYPDLESEDIREALQYAAEAVRRTEDLTDRGAQGPAPQRVCPGTRRILVAAPSVDLVLTAIRFKYPLSTG